jgi:hypothetical protein
VTGEWGGAAGVREDERLGKEFIHSFFHPSILHSWESIMCQSLFWVLGLCQWTKQIFLKTSALTWVLIYLPRISLLEKWTWGKQNFATHKLSDLSCKCRPLQPHHVLMHTHIKLNLDGSWASPPDVLWLCPSVIFLFFIGVSGLSRVINASTFGQQFYYQLLGLFNRDIHPHK